MTIKIDGWTVPQMTTEALEEALKNTTDKRKIRLIRDELRARKSLGAKGPLKIEDFLG